MPRVAELLRPPPGKPIIALVKPQFEVGRHLVGKGGVVRDPDARRGAVERVRSWAAAHGFVAGEDVESPITGPAGNVEYLLLLSTTGAERRERDPRADRGEGEGAGEVESESEGAGEGEQVGEWRGCG